MKQKKGTYFLAGVLTAILLLNMVVPVLAAGIEKVIEVSTGVTVYLNGARLNTPDAFIFEGTTYLPVRAISEALNVSVQWDGSTRSVYLGKIPGAEQYLLDVCPPYQTSDTYITPDIITMAGQKYTKGFTFSKFQDQYALFNLNGQYDTLSFDVGHRDGKDMFSGALNIYLDNNLEAIIELDGEMLPQHYDVDLHGALQMKVVLTGYSDWWGIVNIVVK